MPALRYLWVAVLLLLASCHKDDPRFFGRIDPPRAPNELSIILSTEPEYLDPGLASESSGGFLIRNVFAGLVQVHPQSLEPMPDIARRWDISDDGRIYTFHLRRSAWSDGTPLTAHDFAWSWMRVLDPVTASKYATFAYSFQNAAAYNQQALHVTGLGADTTAEQIEQAFEAQVPVASVTIADWPERSAFVFIGGEDEERADNRTRAIEHFHGRDLAGTSLQVKPTAPDVVGIRVLDDYTLEARLENPLPFFLDQLTFYTLRPVPRHVFERLEREGQPTNRWVRPENWVSNGPYVIAEWAFRQHYILEKNPRYWAADDVRIERVRLPIVENANTTLNLYRTGDVDWIGQTSVLPNEFSQILQRYEDLRSSAYLGVYFYWVNVDARPVDDVRVRRALSLAIDREAICEHITRGGQIPMAGLVPDGLAGYDAPDLTLFDPAEARRLLAEAGYPNGEGLPQITLDYNTSEGHKQIAEAIQQMWKRHLGIDVTLENQEWNVYQKTMLQMDFQLGRMGWIGDYADPYTFLELLTKPNGNNHSNWSSDEYDRLLEQANTIVNRQERNAVLRRAEDLLLQDLPIIPVYVYSRLDMVKPYVRGYWNNLQNIHPIKWMYIDERFDGGDVPANWAAEDPPLPVIPFE